MYLLSNNIEKRTENLAIFTFHSVRQVTGAFDFTVNKSVRAKFFNSFPFFASIILVTVFSIFNSVRPPTFFTRSFG